MHDYQRRFLEFTIANKVLKFGQFTLKSGRISPYFFNAGLFHHAHTMKALGEFYALAIQDAKMQFDTLFGPAYKGIPLATTTAIALSHCGQNPGLSFNRKEEKKHGEGGQLIGAPITGKVLIIDDVITAGTAFRQAQKMVESHGGEVSGVILALDRQERGQGSLSAIDEIKCAHGIAVHSIIRFEHIVEFITEDASLAHFLPQILEYRERFGIQT